MNENVSQFSPETDPQLTAYALGELDAAEQAVVEARLREDPEARATVESIRATAAQIEAALATEPLPAVEPAAAPKEPDPYRRPKGRLLRFPQLYFVTATLMAACFTALVVLHEPAPKPEAAKKHYVEVPLQTLELPAATPQTEQPAPPQVLVDANAMAAPEDGVVRLSPFEVKEEKDYGYLTTHSKAATRIGMEIQPVPMNIPAHSRAEEEKAKQAQVAEAERLQATGAAPALMARKAAIQAIGGWFDETQARLNTEAYAYQPENGFLATVQNPLSTFSIDVDTASYANVRRFLNSGQRPPVDAVRIEELVNYFPYRYAPPGDSTPFAAALEVAEAPWAPAHRLVRIGLKGREVSQAAWPAANLVFLLDVSGSMHASNKLPLVKESLRLLVGKLRPDDRVAIVTYAGNSGLALASTPVRRAAEILGAVDALTPGGSTNGAMGIQLAYDIAKANFVEGGVNRVILCTDGDFNVGTTSESDLVRLIEEKAQSKVFLTVLGFGMGNLKDSTMEKLADKGNGNYGYIDSRREAEKLLVEQANGTLVTIAKDVKIQVEFNPAQVASYRLIGYENRMLKKEDFNNDAVDAGEIGAGHTVTALYEVVPVGAADAVAATQPGTVDELKYRTPDTGYRKEEKTAHPVAQELLTVKVRYKEPTGDVSRKLEFPLVDRGTTFAAASADFKLAAAVASFGMILRDSPFKGSATFAQVTSWAQDGLADDAGGYRSEFLTLVGKAAALPQ